jgi:hypothetical protein
MSNKRDLRAFVRFDGSGRIVAGSLILRKNKPKVGKWHEIQAYECCNYIPTTTTTTTATPTTTTTTTVVPTTTTTTTSAIAAFLSVSNSSEDIVISSVTVNGVLAAEAGCCMPAVPAGGATLSTTQSGTCTIVVSYATTVGNQSIKVTQSGGGVQCQNVIAGGGTLTFTGVNVAGFQNPLIEAQIITC